MRRVLQTFTLLSLLISTTRVDAAEICGNGIDDDADGNADEGCYPTLTTGQCESPLSCEDTGMVSPTTGSLHYSLPPDIAPKVPYGPGIGLRRFYLSQHEPSAPAAPTFQAAGPTASGTGAVSPAWPTHQAGDVALLIVETSAGEHASLSDAQGFQAVTGADVGDDSAGGTRLAVFWKRATSSSEAAPTVADSGDHTLSRILTFRGVIGTGNPWDVVASGATSGTAVMGFTMPGTTTTKSRSLLVNAISITSAFTSSIEWNNQLSQVSASTTSGDDGYYSVAFQQVLSPGMSTAESGYFYNSRFDTETAQKQARLVIALKPDDAVRRPFGDRWSHTYMSWLDKWTAPNPDQVVVHTSRGQDVMFTFSQTLVFGNTSWHFYTPSAPFKSKYQYLRQRGVSPNEYELRTLTGETIIYDSNGKMIEIWDSLQTPNKVLIAYDGNGQVSTVTDASGVRRLLFSYTGGLLTSVAFQINTGSWTTQHSTSYGYNNDLLSTVTIGGALAQTHTWLDGHLRQINDGGGLTIAKFVHDAAVLGKIVRVETGRGVLGWEFNSSRMECSGKTALYFNRGNTTSCSSDTDCGSGFMCGGKTGSSGATGQCFRAARCLTTSSPSEDVVTAVSAFGPSSETCEGACLDAISYTWNTGTELTLRATEDPSSKFVRKTFNRNGLPTKITYGASDPSGFSPGTRDVFLFYGNSTFPGKVTEVRRKSDLSTSSSSCSESNTTGCARTLYTYNADGLLSQLDETGFTYSDEVAPYTHTTTYAYNSTHKDLIAQIDGPLSGSNDVTVFEYWSSSDPLKNWFLQNFKRKTNATDYLTQSTLTYDFWGNPTAIQDVDGTLSCMTYDSARGYLSEHREAMNGQTSCTAHSSDLVTSWVRDAHLRTTRITRPDGSCLHFTYDSMGRLETERRRDDCNAGSLGDSLQYTYSADGLMSKVEALDSNGDVKRRQELTYFDSRRLEKLLNPVDTAKSTVRAYDSRGLLSSVMATDGTLNLGKTEWGRDAEGRISTEKRFTSGTSGDTWTFLFDWMGNQRQVTDGDSKTIKSVRDDLGRLVELDSPDQGGYPTWRLYDEASRVTTMRERKGGTGEKVHSFTYDNIGRLLKSDYDSTCPTGTAQAEIQRMYDAPPSGTCPTGMNCTNTAGRIAYVKVTLFCSSSFSSTDGALDQETWYGYDAAGRVVREYIKDDSGRAADQQYTWTKNGALSKVTLPSGALLGATYGSTAHNSDAERVVAIWRTSAASPIVDNIAWYPFGPLKRYNQMNSYDGASLRTDIERNLAYRITSISVEKQTDGTDLFSVAIEEDGAGRVTHRSYSIAGMDPSYFLYDQSDRVLCETKTYVTGCPVSGSSIKNSHTQSPPFTAAGDWRRLLRPIPGSTGLTHEFSLNGTATHQVAVVDQSDGSPELGRTYIGHDPLGNRSFDDNQDTLSYDRRDYTYDSRRNLINVRGRYDVGQGAWHYYNVTSAFDARNRRVFKAFVDETTGLASHWFFYYDANDRLVEVRYVPDAVNASSYTVVNISWLATYPVNYWQTDYPSATSLRSYVQTDESGRPLQLTDWSNPSNCSVTWRVNPSAWGDDTMLVDLGVFQPLLFAGQYVDHETAARQNSTILKHRPALALNGFRTYDPFTGSYLQLDPLVDRTKFAYVFADGNPVGNRDPSGLMITTSSVACQYNPLQGGYMPSDDSGYLDDPSMYGLGECEGVPRGGGGFGGGGGGGGGGPEGVPSGEPGGTSDDSACRSHLIKMNVACAFVPWRCGRPPRPQIGLYPGGEGSGEKNEQTAGAVWSYVFGFEEEQPPRGRQIHCLPDEVYCAITNTCETRNACLETLASCDSCWKAYEEYDACTLGM